jgi:hypothetical protein
MVFTEHAKIRQQQRGFRFSPLVLQVLEHFAREKHAQGGATKLFFGKKEAARAVQEFKRAIQALDKVVGSTMIEAGGRVLTLYKG